MTFSLCDTFANPQGCHIIWEALYKEEDLLSEQNYYTGPLLEALED